ncbi:MAG: hypothetical protein IT457_01115 [Planctomycetes bacterium]|nr:hypothetical protein [Planctomycetota bacterium]
MLRTAILVSLAAGLATAQTQDRVVLKSGRVLLGSVERDGPFHVSLRERELGAIDVPRTAVRAVLRGELSADPFAPEAPAEPGDAPETYIRWLPARADEDGGLETATSRWFDPASESTVFLVGVVHIADPAYYAELQKVLDACDLVLFEGVGKGEASDAELASLDVMMRMQLALRGATGLGFQKDHLEYAREFWVNSDVDYGELRAALRERKASLPTDHPVVARLLKTALSVANGSDARRSPRLQHRLKNLMGPGLAQADAILQRPNFAGMRGAVIEHRNGAVMRDLDRTLAEGAHGRWIAVFYGAGHLPDFATRFAQRGMRYEGVGWHRAWRMPAREPDEGFDRKALDRTLGELESGLAGARLSVQLATVGGEDRYGYHDEDLHDGASSLALLAEFLAAHDGRLDAPVADPFGGSDGSAAAPTTLRGRSARRIGAALLGDDAALRMAARSVIDERLGGAADALRKARARFATVGSRSLDEPASVVRVLRAIAAREVRGLGPSGAAALADLLFVGCDEAGRWFRFRTSDAAGRSRSDCGFLEVSDEFAIVWSVGCSAGDGVALPDAAALEAVVERLVAQTFEARR